MSSLSLVRSGGRSVSEQRPVKIIPGYVPDAEGSALIETGNTRVMCAATVELQVPPWMRGKGTGWVTAEYSMLPRSTTERVRRERGTIGGRTQEIQRLIGRALRAITDLPALGEISILLDCDVLRADGGTRTASITGAYVALHLALAGLIEAGKLKAIPLKDQIAAISVGIVDGDAVLDLDYNEDSAADVDMNVVMTGGGEFVELQGTGEEATFDRNQLEQMLELADSGIKNLLAAQRAAIGSYSWHNAQFL
ncbi:MAG: ribonuclease PH [Dehalococcoidia bacterium]|jgi:ribonuclease PH|nr:ribonuclease PH [Dehalococcoidia bacterium]|tara:strand:+ start:111 stop:866 length:756 start_codon:yes stop_codon:yes gene_type:complete